MRSYTLPAVVCSTLLLTIAMAFGLGEERYFGGSFDGYAEGLFLQSDPMEFGARFSGGSYDGYDDSLLLQSDPLRFAARYMGGSYDGYDEGLATNQFNALNLDSDEDGLTDWWETDYFNSLAILNADNDYDSDGDSDAVEFLALTDPTDSNAYFRILHIEETNTVAVSFPCSPLRVYDLQSSTSLVSAIWVPVDGRSNIVGDASGMMSLIDTNRAAWRAYRVNVKKIQDPQM